MFTLNLNGFQQPTSPHPTHTATPNFEVTVAPSHSPVLPFSATDLNSFEAEGVSETPSVTNLVGGYPAVQQYGPMYPKAVSAIEGLPSIGLESFAQQNGIPTYIADGAPGVTPGNFGSWFGLQDFEINNINSFLGDVINADDGFSGNEAYLFADHIREKTEPYYLALNTPPAPTLPTGWSAMLTGALDNLLQGFMTAGYLPTNFTYSWTSENGQGTAAPPPPPHHGHGVGHMPGGMAGGHTGHMHGGVTIQPGLPSFLGGHHNH